jgi:hypothetical protein
LVAINCVQKSVLTSLHKLITWGRGALSSSNILAVFDAGIVPVVIALVVDAICGKAMAGKKET